MPDIYIFCHNDKMERYSRPIYFCQSPCIVQKRNVQQSGNLIIINLISFSKHSKSEVLKRYLFTSYKVLFTVAVDDGRILSEMNIFVV